MTSTKLLFIAFVALIFTGCQPARDQRKTTIGIGRLGPGTSAQQSMAANKQWGIITNSQGDQAFWTDLSYFTYPQLSGTPDGQVGNVSSQANQQTGVFFNGNAHLSSGNFATVSYGNVSLDSLSLNIFIYDDKVQQYGPISHPYTSGTGYISGGYVYLTFQDSNSLVMMMGTIQGQTFSGQIGFQNQYTSGQSMTLGDFSVPTCGFFQCQ